MKIIPASSLAKGPSAPPLTREERAARAAIQAAIESQRSRYIKLNCGHLTTFEVEELYNRLRPDPKKSFCENCGKWVARSLPPARTESADDEPLF